MRPQVCRLQSALLLCLFLAAGCGPKVTLHPGAAGRSIETVALLPTAVPEGMQRERVEYVRELLRHELESAGFVLLDDRLVRAACSSPACSERTALSREFELNGLFELELESTRRVNFLAGYYNSLTGTLLLRDGGGEELARIIHTERSRGGVLFESGQVIQGIINQLRDSRDEAGSELGGKFVRTVVNALPARMKSGSLGRLIGVSIFSVEDEPVLPEVSKICLQGTANSIAALIVKGSRATLRETSPGRYCGIFRLESGSGNTVELRSPFGAAVRRDLARPIRMPVEVSADAPRRARSTAMREKRR